MSRFVQTIGSVLATIGVAFLTGCTPTQPFYFTDDGDMSHYKDVATEIEYPDVDTCASRQVVVDTTDFRAGGSVAVTVTCSASNRGVEVVQDGPRTYTVRATARIDPFRATEGG